MNIIWERLHINYVHLNNSNFCHLKDLIVTNRSPWHSLQYDVDMYHVHARLFVKQTDGCNCGPIACLKFMEIFGFISMDQIPNILQAMSGAPYRRLVYNQHLMCLDILKDELIASEKVNFNDLFDRLHQHIELVSVLQSKVRFDRRTIVFATNAFQSMTK